jgi:hypothetical protein
MELGVVHTIVRSTHEIVEYGLSGGNNQRPEATPKATISGGYGVHLIMEAVGDGLRRDLISHLHEHQKLVAAHASKDVRTPDSPPHVAREYSKARIAGSVTLPVIKLLQAIEVRIDQEPPLLAAHRPGCQLKERLPIERPCQRVGSRKPPLAHIGTAGTGNEGNDNG